MLQADYRFSDVQATYKIYKKRLYGDVSMTISAEKKTQKKRPPTLPQHSFKPIMTDRNTSCGLHVLDLFHLRFPLLVILKISIALRLTK